MTNTPKTDFKAILEQLGYIEEHLSNGNPIKAQMALDVLKQNIQKELRIE